MRRRGRRRRTPAGHLRLMPLHSLYPPINLLLFFLLCFVSFLLVQLFFFSVSTPLFSLPGPETPNGVRAQRRQHVTKPVLHLFKQRQLWLRPLKTFQPHEAVSGLVPPASEKPYLSSTHHLDRNRSTRQPPKPLFLSESFKLTAASDSSSGRSARPHRIGTDV